MTILAVSIAAIAIWLVFREPTDQRKLLLDGSTLSVNRVKLGKTNLFTHGSWADRTIGSHFSSNVGAVKLFKLDIKQPTTVAQGGWEGSKPLSIEFQLVGPNAPGSNVAKSLPACRYVHWGEDGYKYFEDTKSFIGFPDGYFGYLTTSTFSRRSKMIHVRIDQKDSAQGLWRSLAEFEIKNPNPIKEEFWPAERFPVRKSDGNFAVELNKVEVYRPRNGLHRQIRSWIWEQRVDYLFRFFVANQSVSNWRPHDVSVDDSTGNSLLQSGWKGSTNGFVLYSGFRTADPSAVWKLQAHFSPDSGFSESNVFHFKVPRGGMVKTNFGGFETSIEFDGNRQSLLVSIPTNSVNSRLLFLGARNDLGESIEPAFGSSEQHSFFQPMLNLMSTTSNIVGKIAIVPDVPFEFTVKPLMEPGEFNF
jgi:hypothetical protein